MGFKPVPSETAISDERHRKGEGVLHLFKNDALYLFLLIRIDGEVEFVVYLKNHLTLDALGLKTIEDVDHCHFDDVGSGALNGGVDSIALSKTTYYAVSAVDVWQVATTSE